jgi:hypothetical protein
MKRLVSIIFVVVFLLVVGTAAADPGGNNPYIGMVTNVDCDGEDHDYDLLYTVGLAPWFDSDSNVVGIPAWVERQNDDGSWELMGQIPGQGIPSVFCTWDRGDIHFRGEVQFAPPQ